MRNLIVVLFSLLVAVAAAAQEKPYAVFVFVGNPSYIESDSAGRNFDGVIGLALQRTFAERWAAEVTVSRESGSIRYTTFDRRGDTIESRTRSWHATPVDVALQYRFPNDTSWKPYVGVGARWSEGPPNGFERLSVLGGVNAGVVWQFRPALGLRFDAKVLVAPPTYLDALNGSVGLSWRF